MNRYSVKSSNIRSIGYDPENEVLEVEFHYGNAVYQYFNVSESKYKALMKAMSKGIYFNTFIKPMHRTVKLSR